MLDRFLPVLLGYRTELLGLAIMILQILGVAGVIDPTQANDFSKVLGGGAIATAAAKLERR